MKISVIGPTYPFKGGIAHWTTAMVRELRREHAVQFLSFAWQYPRVLFPGNTTPDPSPAGDAIVEPCERVLSPLDPRTWRAGAEAIRAHGAELVLIPWWSTYWAPLIMGLINALCKGRSPRVVMLCHNIAQPDGEAGFTALTRRVLRRADALVTFHPADAGWVRRHLPRAALLTSPLPALTHTFAPSPDRAQARRELGVAAHHTLFLMFGFVRPYKGVDVLLEAFAQLDDARARLMIAGEVWRQSRRTLARRRSDARIMVHDWYIPNGDVGRYFEACDCVVLPYVRPVASGVAQLSKRHGKPMIASALLDKAMFDPAVDARVPPGDALRLAAAMLHMCRRDHEISLSPDRMRAMPVLSWTDVIARVASMTDYCKIR